MVRDLAISWNPGDNTFGLAPRSSSFWGACSGELPDEAELEGSLRACCSSSRRCQALFHQLELQLWQCNLRSPRLQGILPTETAVWDTCTFTHFQYSDSVGLLALPVIFKGVGELAGSSADAVGW